MVALAESKSSFKCPSMLLLGFFFCLFVVCCCVPFTYFVHIWFRVSPGGLVLLTTPTFGFLFLPSCQRKEREKGRAFYLHGEPYPLPLPFCPS